MSNRLIKNKIERKKKKNQVKKFFNFIMILIIGVVLFNVGALVYSNTTVDANANAATIIVSKGDTLWSIAACYVGKNTDIRKVVYDIKEINDLDKSTLNEGQILKIPGKYSRK